MDQTETVKQFEERLKKNVNRFVIILMAAIVTIMAIVAIIPRWSAFNSVAKFDAVLFLLILVTNPMFEFFTEKRVQEGYGRYRGSLTGYVLTMLAIMLFARH